MIALSRTFSCIVNTRGLALCLQTSLNRQSNWAATESVMPLQWPPKLCLWPQCTEGKWNAPLGDQRTFCSIRMSYRYRVGAAMRHGGFCTCPDFSNRKYRGGEHYTDTCLPRRVWLLSSCVTLQNLTKRDVHTRTRAYTTHTYVCARAHCAYCAFPLRGTDLHYY